MQAQQTQQQPVPEEQGPRGRGQRGEGRRGRGERGRGRGRGSSLPQIPEEERPKTVEEALAVLATIDWGTNVIQLMQPIPDAIVATHGDTAPRAELEQKILDALQANDSPPAKDYLFRQLALIGTVRSVPTLAGYLANPELSHKARFALERIPAPEVGETLRGALATAPAEQKIGVISTLGARQEDASVASLAELLSDSAADIASAAALALGAIGSENAAEALASKPATEGSTSAVAHASLACAENLLADGKRADALVIYRRLAADGQPKHIQVAATRGMLASASAQ